MMGVRLRLAEWCLRLSTSLMRCALWLIPVEPIELENLWTVTQAKPLVPKGYQPTAVELAAARWVERHDVPLMVVNATAYAWYQKQGSC